jgi:hypothetical protein
MLEARPLYFSPRIHAGAFSRYVFRSQRFKLGKKPFTPSDFYWRDRAERRMGKMHDC